jgi:2-polyprenyl-3-methyl-5-hydroxy-6-metoxy-1,4-benzoquinol methylase
MEERLYQQFYDIEDKHWWFKARRAILMAYLAQRVNITGGLRLLDVGCGTGAFLADASRYFDVYGTDNAPEAIRLCKERGLTNLYVGTLDVYSAPKPFDVITLLDVIEHTDDDLDILRRARSLLKDGGHVLITVPAYQWLWSVHDEVNHHRRRYTRTRLEDVVTKAGFAIEHMSYFNAILFPIAAVRRVIARALHTREAGDFEIPGTITNTILRRVFGLERHLLPRMSFPFGLSVLCWATKPAP